MTIIVLANEEQRREILTRPSNADAEIIFVENFDAVLNQNADAYILVDEVDMELIKGFTSQPVFINSVVKTLKELALPKYVSRINGWPSFLQRHTWEISTQDERPVKQIFDSLHWKYLFVNDEPGLVSARIISMIINEACFALGDGISTKEEIDIAMKLGTNYPYGPFEWAKKIGWKNIYELLTKLSENNSRYTIASSLQKQITGIE